MLSEAISGLFADCWATDAKKNTITTRSKEWWNNECSTALETYRRTGERLDWFFFCSATRRAKRCFFDNRIAEIAYTNKRPWDLMSWVKQRKLPAVEAIRFQGSPVMISQTCGVPFTSPIMLQLIALLTSLS